MPSAQNAQDRLPILDILRGCAVFAVFLQHLGDRFRPFLLAQVSPSLTTPASALLSRGHWGVDLFFVLSGFSLGLGFVDKFRKARTATWPAFLKRRAQRILPGYLVALAVTLVAKSAMLDSPHFPKALLLHLILLQGYVSAGGLVWIGASWSLTTEAHFYLVAPQLSRLFLPAKNNALSIRQLLTRALLLCLAVWALRSGLHAIALHPDAPTGMLELSQRKWAICRIDQFILGMAASVLYLNIRSRPGLPAKAPISLAISLIFVLCCVPLDDAFFLHPLGGLTYPPLSLSLALLVLSAALFRPGSVLATVLAPVQFLGIVSYGFFLYHQLCLELAPKLLAVARADNSWISLLVTAGFGGASALLAATISWYLIESPALRFPRNKSD